MQLSLQTAAKQWNCFQLGLSSFRNCKCVADIYVINVVNTIYSLIYTFIDLKGITRDSLVCNDVHSMPNIENCYL